MKKIVLALGLLGLLLSSRALAQSQEKESDGHKKIFVLGGGGGDQEKFKDLKDRDLKKDDQDSPKQPKKRCDVATTEKCKNCEECKKDLTDKDLKDGKCSKCEKEPKEVEYCVKKTWKCECEGAKPKTTEPKVKECKKCKKEFKEEVNKCKTTGWVCPKCDKKSDKEGECDGEKCKKAKFVKTCEKSGEAPHVGGKSWGDDERFKCEHGNSKFTCPECKKGGGGKEFIMRPPQDEKKNE